MFQTTIANVMGMMATDLAGKVLHIAGASPVVPGQRVWTDGNIIYGNTYGGGDAPIFIPRNGFIWLDYYNHCIMFTDNINKPFRKLCDTDSLLITSDDKGNLYSFGDYISQEEHISLMVEPDACINGEDVYSIRIIGTEWQRDLIGVFKNGDRIGSVNVTEYFKSGLENKAKSLGWGGEVKSSPSSQCYINRLTIHPDGTWIGLVHGNSGAGSSTLEVTAYDFDGYLGFYRRRYGSEVNEAYKLYGSAGSVTQTEGLGTYTRETATDMPVGYRGTEPLNDSEKCLVLQGNIFSEDDKNIVEALLDGTGLEGYLDGYFNEMLKLYNGEDKRKVIVHEYKSGVYKVVKILRYCPVSLPAKSIKNTEHENCNASFTWELDNTICYLEGKINPAMGYLVSGTQTVEGYSFPSTNEVKDAYKMKDGSWLMLVKPSEMYYELKHCRDGKIETLIGSGTDFRNAHVARIRPVRKSKVKKVLGDG